MTYQVGNGPATKVILTQAKSGGYISRPLKVGGKDHVFFVREIQQPALLVDVQKLEPVAQFLPGTPGVVNGETVAVKEYHLYSGLETKRDPGIPIVYFGCGAMIFGLAMVGVSHREVWLRRTEEGWMLAGRTHKGRVMLRKELEAIAALWPVAAATPQATPDSPDLGAQAS
jgi:cytochrome c biogenesis protein ResB